MKNIVYFADFSEPQYAFTKEIERTLKTKYKVESVNDRDFDMADLLKKAKKVDLFLFHQGGVHTDTEMNYPVSVERLKQILTAITCKKVCWFTDKVWFLNDKTMEETIPLIDYVFLNDDTWVRRHKYDNVFPLHLATGSALKGLPKKEYACDLAFYGEIYGFNKPYIEFLKSEYGARFKVFPTLIGQDLADLIASAKMIFTPVQPYEEFYWDDRIYQILNHRGLALFPMFEGLKEEGFIAGEHYLGYKMVHQLRGIIDHYLSSREEREKIKEQGYKFIQRFSYEERIKEIMKRIK